jgi:flagellar L-ring protein precursor FlgH
MTALFVATMLSATPAHARKMVVPEPPQRPPPTYVVEAEDTSHPGVRFDEQGARRLMGIDGHARQPGDLITVRIDEAATTDLGAATSASKSSNNTAAIDELLGLDKRALRAFKNMDRIGIDLSSSSSFDGSGSTNRSSNVEAIVTTEVIEVLPAGNLRVWGYKQITVNRETQYLVVDGIVRPRDVQMDNSVSSELMAEAKIEITGSGVISDKQGPGWGARLLDALWPF